VGGGEGMGGEVKLLSERVAVLCAIITPAPPGSACLFNGWTRHLAGGTDRNGRRIERYLLEATKVILLSAESISGIYQQGRVTLIRLAQPSASI
jgi:hypothetical protein